jgi:hypothetical protein
VQSFTGVEILRVLKANNVGPILMIAFTNHALDHMLCSVLDANITRNIVRLGSRSSDERISQYSIETMELADGQSRLDKTFGNRRRELKRVQEDITKLMGRVLNLDIESDSAEIMKYLSTFYPDHHEYLAHPPAWISTLKDLFDKGDDATGVWHVQGRKGKSRVQDRSDYAYWKDCGDVDLVGAVVDGAHERATTAKVAPKENRYNTLKTEEPDGLGDDDDADEESVSQDGSLHKLAEDSWMEVRYEPPLDIISEEESPVLVTTPSESLVDEPSLDVKIGPADFKDPEGFLAAVGCERNPAVLTSDRPLEELIDHVVDVWAMSRSERRKLHAFWVNEARIELTQNQTEEFERLHERHAEMLRECNEGKEEVRIQLQSMRFLTPLSGSTEPAPEY